jgi:nucleotide-binding universal stress UspA family protein
MKEIKRIVVPVDFSQNSVKLVDYAVNMADKLAASVHFVHVAELGQGHDMLLGSSDFGGMKEKIMSAAEERMANLIEDYGEKNKGCSGKVLTGDTVKAIVDEANAVESDLVIIGTHGAQGLERILLGSVAERVVKRASCPVLTMNPYK